MTLAVCLGCGEMKHGAWTRCRSCGFEPDDDECMTKSLLLTDHFHGSEALGELAARIKSGKPVEFDPQQLERMRVDSRAVKRSNRNCAIGCTVLMLSAVTGAVLAIRAWF